MKEIFHYHLTIGRIDSNDLAKVARLLKAKPTTIDLFNNQQSQQDRMVTKYSNKYRDIRKAMFEDVERLKQLGYDVVRAKIEQVTDKLIYRSDCLYSEAHIKVADDNLEEIYGLKLSNNPVDGTRFYNGRVYGLVDYINLEMAIEEVKVRYNVVSEQYEICLFDSNQSHDSWWSDTEEHVHG